MSVKREIAEIVLILVAIGAIVKGYLSSHEGWIVIGVFCALAALAEAPHKTHKGDHEHH
jgi:high-affinity Fe2+/Pb2+ permease